MREWNEEFFLQASSTGESVQSLLNLGISATARLQSLSSIKVLGKEQTVFDKRIESKLDCRL